MDEPLPPLQVIAPHYLCVKKKKKTSEGQPSFPSSSQPHKVPTRHISVQQKEQWHKLVLWALCFIRLSDPHSNKACSPCPHMETKTQSQSENTERTKIPSWTPKTVLGPQKPRFAQIITILPGVWGPWSKRWLSPSKLLVTPWKHPK